MKSSIRPLVVGFAAVCSLLQAAPEIATQLDLSSATTPAARKFYFETTPGQRYSLWRSTDLRTWQEVAGFPKVADGLSLEHTFAQQDKEFFQIEPIDEQAPVIVSQAPLSGSQTHGRFQPLEFVLKDATEINPSSIQLAFSGGATYSLSSSQLTFDGGHLVYQNPDTALGNYGQAVAATLTVADTFGNSAVYPINFSLEKQAAVSANLFVFGSVAAQRAGQKLPPGPMSDWVRQTQGPVPAGGGDEWFISSVDATTVTIDYTGVIAPVFATGTYLANKTPRNLNEVFYRKILSTVEAAPPLKRLTLYTADVPVEEIVENGTCTTFGQGPMMEVAVNGDLSTSTEQPGKHFGVSHTFPRMGGYLAKNLKIPSSGNPKIQMEARDVSIWNTFTLGGGVTISNHQIQGMEGSLTVDVDLVQRWSAIYHAAGDNITADGKPFSKTIHGPFIKLFPVGSIGFLPLFAVLEYKTDFVIEGETSADISLNFGATETFSRSLGFNWTRGNLAPQPYLSGTASTRRLDPITLTGGGEASFSIGLKPTVSLTFMKLAGAYLNCNPRIEGRVEANGGFGYDFEKESWDWHAGESIYAKAGFVTDLNAGLIVVGIKESDLPHLAPYKILDFQREKTWPEGPLKVAVPGGGMSVYRSIGDSITLDGLATGGTSAISYLWYKDGAPLPLHREKTLTMPITSMANAGNYKFVARSGDESVESPVYQLGVGTSPIAPPTGFERIPAGNFTMGQDGIATPVHSVYVSEFYMAKYETTKELWDEVRDWGMANGRGYTDLAVGNGSYASKGINHPVHSITWYDMVKWCNARSEKENLVPCYTVSGTTYKTGQDPAVVCNFAASGYRLPTEAEWEKAARGGLSGKLFPWGTDTISQSQANYGVYSSNGTRNYYSYDVTPRPPATGTYFYHPSYTAGGYPYTAPVNSFTPNDYGLYNMSGNVWEWCWDWYGSYTAGLQTDPQGAPSGSRRVIRGASWYGAAYSARCAYRVFDVPIYYPASAYDRGGFRIARSSVP